MAFDPLARAVLPVVSLLYLICSLYGHSYLRVRDERPNRIFVTSMLAVVGMLSAGLQARHLGLLWIATEVIHRGKNDEDKHPLSVVGVNEACGISFDSETICTPDAYCRTSSSAAFGVCNKLPTEGQPCATSDNLCATPYTCIGGVCKIFDRSTCK